MWLDLQVHRPMQAATPQFVLDVALQCTQRQVVLFGPSGAGKSLTLKAVAGLLRPWRGHDSHMHIRLRCPAGSPDCRDIAPPPPPKPRTAAERSEGATKRQLHAYTPVSPA